VAAIKENPDQYLYTGLSEFSPLAINRAAEKLAESIDIRSPVLPVFFKSRTAPAGSFSIRQEPLYSPEDFYYFDRFQDGDDYSDPFYQERFLIILEALRERKALWITYQGKHASSRTFEAVPYQLQYSDKDDKFRLCCLIRGRNSFNKKALLNLNRLEDCFLSSSRVPDTLEKHRFTYSSRQRTVTFEISKERNALNRCLLHFAPYEKQTIYHEKTDTYQCTLSYEIADETDLLIQLLSFGPVLRILGPEDFLRQVRQRVRRQQAAGLIHPFKLLSPCSEKNPF